MNTAKPCLDCQRITTHGSRCESCRLAKARLKKTNPIYRDPRWVAVSRTMLETWRKRMGAWCPGVREINHKPHHTNDLTVDHITPLVEGGPPFEFSNLRVICRSANGTLGALARPPRG